MAINDPTWREKMVRIGFFYAAGHERDCEGAGLAMDNLHAVLDKAGLKYTLEVRTLLTEEDAIRWKVIGSPSILVNGKDIEKSISSTQGYSLKCRAYMEGRKPLNAPSKLMILKALNGEQANPMICYCKGVRKDAIVAALKAGAKTFREVKSATGASTGDECDAKNPTGKCCSPFVMEIIRDESERFADAGGDTCCKRE